MVKPLCCWSSPTPAAPPKVTDIRQDLARFDGLFGLPAARLQVVNSLARSPSPWLADEEEVEDTEIVHAVAPAPHIREILISDSAQDSPAAAATDGSAALRLGLTQGAVISLSPAGGEHCFTPAEVAQLNAALQTARDHDVTVINSSGDFGAVSSPCPVPRPAVPRVKGVNLLAADPLALAAGGTSLQASHATGAYIGETAWNSPPGRQPPGSQRLGRRLQQSVPPARLPGRRSRHRSLPRVPDVAADAEGNTGMALALTDGGQNYVLAGTLTGPAPPPRLGRGDRPSRPVRGPPLGFVNPAIYRIGRSPSYHQAFHEVTTGTNTVVFPAARPLPATGPRPAGIRSPAGEAPTPRCSSPCSPATPAPQPTGRSVQQLARSPAHCDPPLGQPRRRRGACHTGGVSGVA